jgi:hypothetical protein
MIALLAIFGIMVLVMVSVILFLYMYPVSGPVPVPSQQIPSPGPVPVSSPEPVQTPVPEPVQTPVPGPAFSGKRGRRILNERAVNGVPIDAKGRFYVACYGPDDGYGGKGAYSNDLVPMKSIALPRGRVEGREQSLLTTAFDHPLAADALKAMKTWTTDDEYRMMKDEKNRPTYLMVDEDGTEHCVRVDDKCEGCYWSDRGVDGSKGFDFDVYTNHPDATCWKHRPNQWVEVYETDAC